MIIIYVLPIQTRMQVDYPKGQSVFISVKLYLFSFRMIFFQGICVLSIAFLP